MPSVDVHIEGLDELRRKLRAMGPRLKKVVRPIVRARMAPVLVEAKALTPRGTGRLAESIGELVSSRKSSVTARVGTRRDFTYTSDQGEKLVSGRGKVRDRALAKGFKQDKTTAQQYARGIEFGVSRDGRIRRKAGGAHMLEHALTDETPGIISGVASDLRRAVESNP